jgi:hypothetical protein
LYAEITGLICDYIAGQSTDTPTIFIGKCLEGNFDP